MATPAFIYMTAKDKSEALGIARVLVEERLAACANVFNALTSLYWWQGAVQEETEVGLIAKTTEDLVERVIARVREIHSYSCPSIVAWPIHTGNPEYLNWISGEVATPAAAVEA